MRKNILRIAAALAAVILLLSACAKSNVLLVSNPTQAFSQAEAITSKGETLALSDIPEYSGEAYVEINGNTPDFLKADLTDKAYEKYGKLDRLGRCTACMACIGTELMPQEKRGEIYTVKPTGWQKISFSFIEGESLYNRCHLIAHQLTGENANPQNLITGTRYLNATGMLPFEEMTGNYVRETGNHVIYRVTPYFADKELVARGVQMEAYSVEDKGKGICFNVYCYNVQPGVEIDYKTGKAKLSDEKSTSTVSGKVTYILNTKSKKFHKPDCEGVKDINGNNKEKSNKSRKQLIDEGYAPCGSCKP